VDGDNIHMVQMDNNKKVNMGSSKLTFYINRNIPGGPKVAKVIKKEIEKGASLSSSYNELRIFKNKFLCINLNKRPH
jgi:hypothetical protein